MAEINYILNEQVPEEIIGLEQYSEKDLNLIDTFQVNSLFDPAQNKVELHILTLADEILESDYNYSNYKLLASAQSAGRQGASIVTIDPIQDAIAYGYNVGGVKLLYHFLKDLYKIGSTDTTFFIQSISPDRRELRLLPNTLNNEQVEVLTGVIKSRLETQSDFTEFRLNFQENNLFIGVNIHTVDFNGQKAVAVKLYEPLPGDITEKDNLTLVEIVSNSVAYDFDTEVIDELEVLPTLRSPNFNIEVSDEQVNPSQYFNYSELFSYPTNSSNNQLYSIVREKGVDISIDHTDFSDFIHFSSAEERLVNFKYKVDLIKSHEANLSSIRTATNSTVGSPKYFEDLIEGVVSNFDHYERYLYYESGSDAWPKWNSTLPYVNYDTTDPIARAWFDNKLAEAQAYDVTNSNSLINTVPTYLREDSNNAGYLMFVYMIGQHFDNIWIYTKAVSDKYNADNRLNVGISKDLVQEALKNFGVKLYTSNQSIEDLFSTFVGQAYQPGNEVVNTYVEGEVRGTGKTIDPTSYDIYQKDIYKRIYHNLPLLLKAKGTERGLRALISCFGIATDILQIKQYGGINKTTLPFLGEGVYVTGSLDKVRLNNTGSISAGNTLSGYTSTVKRSSPYTDDIHVIEVGFSPTTAVDDYIKQNISRTFDIDDYLGDARNLTEDSYNGLYSVAYNLLQGLDTYNLQDYVRLIKFFDKVVFNMVNDFIPARAVADTGIIIKPNLLNRNKAKGVTIEGTRPEYEGTIETAFIEGSNGSSFHSSSLEYTSSWVEQVQTPLGISNNNQHAQEEAKYDGELSGSYVVLTRGELNSQNFLKILTPTAPLVKTFLVTNLPTGGDYSALDYSPDDYNTSTWQPGDFV